MAASHPNRGTYLNDGRVLFAALDKLVIREFGVVVAIHVLEDLVDSLCVRSDKAANSRSD
jgi:hypothetical protein